MWFSYRLSLYVVPDGGVLVSGGAFVLLVVPSGLIS